MYIISYFYAAPVVTMMPQLIEEFKTNIEELQVHIDFKVQSGAAYT